MDESIWQILDLPTPIPPVTPIRINLKLFIKN